ncbi:hypothetical protein VP01_8611g1, partial [Puccinia sorghi]
MQEDSYYTTKGSVLLIFNNIYIYPSNPEIPANFLNTDPEGIAACLLPTCKHQVFHTYCPNNIWSCNENNKFKQFLITIYGTGGIPQKLTSEYNSKTVHTSTWKIYFSNQHG